jgi:diaminopimelate decarboxylase
MPRTGPKALREGAPAAIHRGAEAASIHRGAEAAAIHRGAEAASIHRGAEAASIHRGAEAASIHRGAEVASIPSVLARAAQSRLFSPHDQPLALFFDLDALDSSCRALHQALPGFQHAFAIKANPVLAMLKHLVAEHDFGLECASLSEVELALRAGARPRRVVFDSPCKSRRDLARALELGVSINCDSFEELARVDDMWPAACSQSTIGIRVNPLLGLGAIEALSVSDPTSKFGVPMTAENRQRVRELFSTRPYLVGLHAHVGSQGCSVEMLATGAKILCELAADIGPQVTHLDIGGGLPANFASEATEPVFDTYADALKRLAPALFQGKYTVVTEFGRALVAKTGWAASFVEYCKVRGKRAAPPFGGLATRPLTWCRRTRADAASP